MKRLIDRRLKDWAASTDRKPLLIRGGRQVGKTYSVLELSRTQFNEQVALVNFEKYPELKRVFDLNLDTTRILSELQLLLNRNIEPGRTLLFLDEIQDCPQALKSLRYFCEDLPELHVIAAGSLLEFVLSDASFPVGRVQMISMHPLTFQEYLWATGKDLLSELLLKKQSTIPDSAIGIINAELHSYFQVGGMPSCVEEFSRSRDFMKCHEIQMDLLNSFRQDFSKYAQYADKRCIDMVLTSVSGKIGEQIKYSSLAENYANPTIRRAFELLEKARLFTSVRSVAPAGLPLGANINTRRFKACFLDIGLMSALSGMRMNQLVSRETISSAFNGKLAEQFVGQEIRAYHPGELYYWSRENRGSSAETDYIISLGQHIVPIEVKSGRAGKLKSLHLLLNQYPAIEQAIVFTEDKSGEIKEQRIKFLPLAKVASLFY